MPAKVRGHYRGGYQTRAKRVREAAYADPGSRCWRCGRTLAEEQARVDAGGGRRRRVRWQAGHTVDGNSAYPLAAEHDTCNRTAGANLANRRKAARRAVELPPAPAGRDVTLIVGPPGAGKSTLAESMPGVHLEREQFGSDAAYRAAVVVNARAAGAICTVIRTCVSPSEQVEWETLAASTRTVVVDPGRDVCLERVARRRRPFWQGEQRAVFEWYAAREGRLNSSERWY